VRRVRSLGRWRVVALGALALICASCNLPTNATALPFSIARTSNNGCDGTIAVTIYLTKAGRLFPVRRTNAAKNTQDAALCALAKLNAGPTLKEQSLGIETAFNVIPEDLGLVPGTTGGLATVELDPYFLSISPTREIEFAFGQIVYTLTALDVGITKVAFTFDDQPYDEVLLPTGEVSASGYVTANDYCSIAPGVHPCSGGTSTTTTPTT
jgi:hypothetical protein